MLICMTVGIELTSIQTHNTNLLDNMIDNNTYCPLPTSITYWHLLSRQCVACAGRRSAIKNELGQRGIVSTWVRFGRRLGVCLEYAREAGGFGIQSAPRHPGAVLWMPSGPNRPPDSSIHSPNFVNGSRSIGSPIGLPAFLGALTLGTASLF